MAVLRDALRIKSRLLQALFEKQGTLASYRKCEVLQIFSNREAKGLTASPSSTHGPSGREVRKGLSLITSRGSTGQEDRPRGSPACLSLTLPQKASYRSTAWGSPHSTAGQPRLPPQGSAGHILPHHPQPHLPFCPSKHSYCPPQTSCFCMPAWATHMQVLEQES